MLTRPTLLFALVAGLLVTSCAGPNHVDAPAVRVLSFNLWHGGDAGGVDGDGRGVVAIAAAIRACGADLVGVQEAAGRAPAGGAERPDRTVEVAELLGFEHVGLAGRRALLSRWPILARSPGGHGVLVDAPGGALALFTCHLAHAPYQPYQLVGIEYHGGAFLDTAAEAVAAAREARGDQVAAIVADIDASGWDAPVFVTGDFNEPSHLDWTAAAVAAGRAPVAVDWPSSGAFAAAGFRDLFRAAHPDPVARPGHTWTPLTAPDDPTDRHDRIDLVLARDSAGRVVVVEHALVVGESLSFADLVVEPWPSDHRAVLAECRVVSRAIANARRSDHR
jgi:exodeoxyribonuclease III